MSVLFSDSIIVPVLFLDCRLLHQGPDQEVCGDASHPAAHHCHPHLHHQGWRRLLLHLRLVLHLCCVSGGCFMGFLFLFLFSLCSLLEWSQKAATGVGHMPQLQTTQQQSVSVFAEWLCVWDHSHAMYNNNNNTTLLPSVNTFALGMFCGAKYIITHSHQS